jgi:hypothetical protein
LELTGSLKVSFKNGSQGLFSDFQTGNAPILAQIISDDIVAIANETTRETWISKSPDWNMRASEESLLFQSDMTNKVTEEILTKGNCGLPSFEESKKVHLKLLDSLLEFLNSNSRKKYDYYPFT